MSFFVFHLDAIFLWLEKRIFIRETFKPVEGLDNRCDFSLYIEASIMKF